MKPNVASIFFFVVSQVVFSQSLVGTWVSDAGLLTAVHFRLIFRADMTYEIDTSLGRTTGTFTFTEDRIDFTPINVGMSAGSAGNNQEYFYTFGDGYLYLHANGVKVKLKRSQGEVRAFPRDGAQVTTALSPRPLPASPDESGSDSDTSLVT